MKRNEIFIIGGAILAAILLFKGQATSSINSTIPFINPFSNLLSKAEAQAINQFGSNIETLQSVKESNLGIAQSILDLERNRADVRISQQQTELDRTQSYIGSQQKIGASAGFANLAPKGDWQNAAQALLSRILNTTAGESVFPDFELRANNQNLGIIQQQAQYEIAQGNIGKGIEMVQRQQGEIDRLNEEYQTRFGGISRYG
jgi:hypothetical protein